MLQMQRAWKRMEKHHEARAQPAQPARAGWRYIPLLTSWDFSADCDQLMMIDAGSAQF